MNALTVQLLPTSYWTDSMITLGFIKNTHRRFHTYVANRINKIRQTTHPEQWFFVPGESNPADLLTRKKLPAQLDQNIWNNGPTFLNTHKDTWNFIQNSNPSLPDSHPDIKAEPQISMVVVAKREPMDLLIDYYSDWEKLKRAVAWIQMVFRVLNKDAQPAKQSPETVHFLDWIHTSTILDSLSWEGVSDYLLYDSQQSILAFYLTNIGSQH